MRKIIQKSLAIVLAASTFFSAVACTNPSASEENASQSTTTNFTRNSEDLYTNLQTNYGFEPDYAYTKPIHDAKGDVKFEFPSEFSPEGLGQININDQFTNGIIDIFIDKDLTLSADPVVKYDDAAKTYIVSANPASRPLVYSEADISKDREWGLAGSYYMVLYYDLETGEKLEKPEITIFDLESEVDAPIISLLVEDGQYLSDTILPTIVGETDEYEFYRVSGKYFSVEELGGEFSKVLNTEQRATLRTKSDLTSQEIETILVALISTPEMSTRQAELLESQIYENLGVITVQFEGE